MLQDICSLGSFVSILFQKWFGKSTRNPWDPLENCNAKVYDGAGSFYAAHRDNEHHSDVKRDGTARPWAAWLQSKYSNQIED